MKFHQRKKPKKLNIEPFVRTKSEQSKNWVRFESESVKFESESGQIWVRIKINSGQNWFRFESESGQIRVRIESESSQIWVRIKSNLGQNWVRFESESGQIWVKICQIRVKIESDSSQNRFKFERESLQISKPTHFTKSKFTVHWRVYATKLAHPHFRTGFLIFCSWTICLIIQLGPWKLNEEIKDESPMTWQQILGICKWQFCNLSIGPIFLGDSNRISLFFRQKMAEKLMENGRNFAIYRLFKTRVEYSNIQTKNLCIVYKLFQQFTNSWSSSSWFPAEFSLFLSFQVFFVSNAFPNHAKCSLNAVLM